MNMLLQKDKELVVENNRVVTIDYTLTNNKGDVLDSSEGREPLVYLQGHANIIPGLEREMVGKSIGAEFKCHIAPKDAYGERDASLHFTVDLAEFGGAHVAEGMQFQSQNDNGDVQLVTVVGIEGDKVTLDANHSLAGEELNFDVKVLDIRDATDEEIQRGSVASASSCGSGSCECGSGGCGCH